MDVYSIPLIFLASLLAVFIFSFLKLTVNLRYKKHIYDFKFKSYLIQLEQGFNYLIVQLASQGLNWITLIFTSYFIGEVDTGGLNIIIRMAVLCSFFKTVINAIKGPDYAYLYHANEMKKLNGEIRYNTKLLVYVALPFLAVLFAFPGFFLGLFSNEYDHLILVFRIVLISTVIDNLFGSVGLLMQMTKEEKRFKNLMLISVGIHLFLGFALTYYYRVQGLAISLLISAMFWNIYSAVILKREHKLKSYFSF